MLKTFSIWLTGHDLGQYRPGIGPNYWGYWRILVPFQGLFFEAAEKHDLAYSYGGTEDDKEEADSLFYAECSVKCKTNLQKWFAWIYIIILREYGYKYFRYK